VKSCLKILGEKRGRRHQAADAARGAGRAAALSVSGFSAGSIGRGCVERAESWVRRSLVDPVI